MSITTSLFGNDGLYGRGKENTTVPLIYKMLATGRVPTALATRMDFIHIEGIDFQMPVGTELTPEGLDLFAEYWQPFARQVYIHYAACGICPYRIINKYITLRGRRRIFRVPIALTPGSFSITSYEDKNGEVQHNVLLLGVDEQPKIFVRKSKYFNGPSTTNNAVVHSLCGLIVQDWLALEDLKVSAKALVKRIQDPEVYLERVPNAAIDALEKVQNFNRSIEFMKFGADGYEVPQLPEVTYMKENKSVYLPHNYTASRHQPTLDKSLIDIEQAKIDFYDLISTAFSVPADNLNKTGKNYRTASVVDEENERRRRMIDASIDDIKTALEAVYAEIYNTTTAVKIPSRMLADHEMLLKLHDRNVINSDATREALLRLVNVPASQGGVGPMTFGDGPPPPKRAREDGDR